MSRPAAPYSAGGAPMLTPAELNKFEAPLIALANLSGGDLRKLFYAFFSFLHRRTDFYCIVPPGGGGGGTGGRMGFQEGQAEQILLASFRQFPLRKVGPRPPGAGPGAAKPAASAPAAAAVKKKAAVKEEAPKKADTKPEKKAADETSAKEPEPKGKADGSSSGTNATSNDANKTEATKPAAKEKTGSVASETVRYTEEGKQIPVGNGGSTSRYVWTQTLEEVTVHVPLPDGLRAKDLDVKMAAGSLSIRRKGGGDDASFAPIDGTLFGRIRPSESTWTLESSTYSSQTVTTLQLVLDKAQKTWWSIVLSGDTPLIDTTMVDSTRHIDTYDDETQAQIRRIMHDQRQQRLGLPSSHKTELGLDDLPPMPGGEQFSGSVALPSGVEYIDGETLDKATIKDK